MALIPTWPAALPPPPGLQLLPGSCPPTSTHPNLQLSQGSPGAPGHLTASGQLRKKGRKQGQSRNRLFRSWGVCGAAGDSPTSPEAPGPSKHAGSQHDRLRTRRVRLCPLPGRK
ncbi:unnamed protein product [Rangifer tarandus platyrhynchus]|uniref:Uncharacterized protein n=1 Tax=Rangifer tarandus platyrhynchus TaxID=3082113 RepID=A0AC59ZE45_RANTA